MRVRMSPVQLLVNLVSWCFRLGERSASTVSSFQATLHCSPVSHNQTPTFFIHPSSSSPAENVVESMCWVQLFLISGKRMDGRCRGDAWGPRAVRKTGGMKGLVRLEGRISKAKGWWRYCRWAGGCVVEGTSKRTFSRQSPPTTPPSVFSLKPSSTTPQPQTFPHHYIKTPPLNLTFPLSYPQVRPKKHSQRKTYSKPAGLICCTGGLIASSQIFSSCTSEDM